MPKTESEGKTCDLDLMLSRYGGLHTWYDSSNGLRQCITLNGWIDDPCHTPLGGIDGNYPNSAFHNKAVRLNINTPADSTWLEEVQTSLCSSSACGCASIEAGIKPDRFEICGEAVESEPIAVRLDLNPDAFEAIHRQASDANKHNRVVCAKVSLSGTSLPKTDRKILFLKDLDVSKDGEYAVTGFEIFDTRYCDHMRGRVLEVQKSLNDGYGAYISVLLTETRYKMNPERGLIHGISCKGRVVNSSGKPFDGAVVSIEFREFEVNQQDGLPKRAFFGEFCYWPKQPNDDDFSNQFTFNLNYISEDAHDLLMPILSQKLSAQIMLTLNLTKEEKELLAATNKLRGDVRHYSFDIRQSLIIKA